MKTIKEWFETLPEPIRSQAIINTRVCDLINRENSLSEAIWNSFIWEKTFEGLDYWKDIADRAEAGDFN